MFSKIRDGSFDPDAARVNRLLQLAFEAALDQDQNSESESSSSDDASSIASSDGEHDGEAVPPTYRRLDADDMDMDNCLINKNSRVIHLLADTGDKFWCGRSPSAAFARATRTEVHKTEAVVCAQCSHAYRASVREP